MAELAHRDALESRFAARFARNTSQFRHELIDLLGDPPDYARVPEEFWQRVEQEANAQLAVVLLLLWSESADLHGLDDADGLRAQAFATSRASESARSFAVTGRDMLRTAGADWSQRMSSGQTIPRGEVIERATSIFGPARAEKMATFETGRAQTDAGETWRRDQQALGTRIRAIWRHSRIRPKGHAGASVKPCPVCTPLLDTDESVWGISAPSGPPLHPNCDCFLEYKVVPAGALPESLLECGGKGGTYGPCPKGVTDWAAKRFKNPAHAKAFAEWFGESKVVNEKGEPLVVYHGTSATVDQFDQSKHALSPRGSSGAAGFFFTDDARSAGHYAKDQGANITPVFLSLSNPKTLSEDEYKTLTNSRADARTMKDRAIAAGYDGFLVPHHREFIAFHSTSVKSATGNRGTFDANSPKLNESDQN